ncbi:MAG: transposase [Syntrophales bacterium]
MLIRAKFKDEMTRQGLLHKIDPCVWQIAWNVNCQPVGDSEATLKYLAPYIFRVAISDSRIVAVKDRTVTFSYRKKGSNRTRKIAFDVIEFIRRFLQHVLPAGFMKVRHYGFMSCNCTVSLPHLRLLILASLQNLRLCLTELAASKPKPAAPKPFCPACGGVLLYLFRKQIENNLYSKATTSGRYFPLSSRDSFCNQP